MKRGLRISLAGGIGLLVMVSVCSPAEGPRKSPFWAVVASAAIPGGGQFYCENYTRGAVFCSAQTALTAMIMYEHILTGEALGRYKSSGDEKDYDDYSDHFDKRNDLLWWGAGILILASADAFVDAHMYDFGAERGVKVGLVENEGIGLHVSLCF